MWSPVIPSSDIFGWASAVLASSSHFIQITTKTFNDVIFVSYTQRIPCIYSTLREALARYNLNFYVTRSWQQIKTMTKHRTEDIVGHFSTSFLGNRRYHSICFYEKTINLIDFIFDHHLYLSCIKLHSRNQYIY